MVDFATIRAAALERHGAEALAARMPAPLDAGALSAVPDDRYLSAMSLRIFRAGLKHSLVDAKWPAFEEVFGGFALDPCARLYDEQLEDLLADRRLIRHMPKLRAVRSNAQAMQEIRDAHGGVGAWLAAWPTSDIVGLWDEIGRRFAQMGGQSAAYFLRMVGKDSFILTDSVVGGLIGWGAIEAAPRGRADRQAIQRLFDAWHEETGLPLSCLSLTLALSRDS